MTLVYHHQLNGNDMMSKPTFGDENINIFVAALILNVIYDEAAQSAILIRTVLIRDFRKNE